MYDRPVVVLLEYDYKNLPQGCNAFGVLWKEKIMGKKVNDNYFMLSLMLRHYSPGIIHVKMDDDSFVSIGELIANAKQYKNRKLKSRKLTLDTLQKLVAESNKQRKISEMSDDEKLLYSHLFSGIFNETVDEAAFIVYEDSYSDADNDNYDDFLL